MSLAVVGRMRHLSLTTYHHPCCESNTIGIIEPVSTSKCTSLALIRAVSPRVFLGEYSRSNTAHFELTRSLSNLG
eukprot:scaffold2767_cov177-Amphora_coffeaeformis.AAC.81